MAREVNVTIGAKIKGFMSGMRKVRRSLRRVGRMAKSMGQAIRKATRVAVIGIAAMVGALVMSVRAAMKQESVEKRLAAVIAATGGAAGLSAKQMQEHAAELERTTTFADEAVIATQGILATFREVKGDEFKRATEAILDMSEVLQQDARSGAIQLGKALNDPIKGVTALRRTGIQMTASQEAMIKSFVEAGDVASAQRVILAELEGQMGGAAKAARNTLGGAFKFLKNQIGTFLEQVGFSLSGGLGLTEMFNNLGERIASAATTIRDKLEPRLLKVRQLVTDIFAADTRAKALEDLGKGLSLAFNVAAATAADFLINKAPAIGEAIGSAFQKMFPGLAGALKVGAFVSKVTNPLHGTAAAIGQLPGGGDASNTAADARAELSAFVAGLRSAPTGGKEGGAGTGTAAAAAGAPTASAFTRLSAGDLFERAMGQSASPLGSAQNPMHTVVDSMPNEDEVV